MALRPVKASLFTSLLLRRKPFTFVRWRPDDLQALVDRDHPRNRLVHYVARHRPEWWFGVSAGCDTPQLRNWLKRAGIWSNRWRSSDAMDTLPRRGGWQGLFNWLPQQSVLLVGPPETHRDLCFQPLGRVVLPPRRPELVLNGLRDEMLHWLEFRPPTIVLCAAHAFTLELLTQVQPKCGRHSFLDLGTWWSLLHSRRAA